MGARPAEDSPTSESSPSLAACLNDYLVATGLDSVDAETAGRFSEFCALLLRWNARMNLTAIRDEEGILSRHFVESIACARALPAGIATLLDFGSGAGFPGIPIALCRPEIAVTLAESQGKKAAFLREAVRTLGISVAVHSGRAEALAQPFDCVTLRAVDRMPEAVQAASALVAPAGWLAIMTTEAELGPIRATNCVGWSWLSPIVLPGSDRRVLALGQRAG
jgi:16S rRNA (guanine527-N7)-methyltransferase